jgi:glycosyltransferase involved in cell wall biosynthesis
MGPLYRGSRVYINASVHEGSSNAVLEAIGAGCAVVLSDIPENRDFGLPDHCYFDPQSPAAIAEALDRAVSDPAGFVVDSTRFLTWDGVARRTLDIYQVMAPLQVFLG